MLDSLTHKVHIIEANGQNHRLEQIRKYLAGQKTIEDGLHLDSQNGPDYKGAGTTLLPR